MAHTGRNTGFGDFIKRDAVGFFRSDLQHLSQVPRNRLSLAVRVGCEIDAVAGIRHLFELTDQRRLTGNVHITGLEAVLHIHTQQSLGQVADMAHRGHDLVIAAQIFLDGLRLCRRLHNHQFRHRVHPFCINETQTFMLTAFILLASAVFGAAVHFQFSESRQ